MEYKVTRELPKWLLSGFPLTEIIYSEQHHQPFCQINGDACGNRDGQQSSAEPRKNDGYGKTHGGRHQIGCRVQNCGKRHRSKDCIGDIIQKGLDEAVFDGLAEHNKRKHPRYWC